jgi:hypothetical protein
MILFIAPNPHKVTEREGFMQRVAAIDSLFKDEEKIYAEDIADPEELAKYLIAARMIYVHSLYQAEKVLRNYQLFGDKIVTDMHGVVPEEELYLGNEEKSKRLAAVEGEIFAHGRNFVGVSNAMVEYLTKKYKLSETDTRWVVLPIFELDSARPTPHKKRLEVIYAGGTQSWQKVPLMVDAINKTYAKYDRFTILTHNPDGFTGIEAEAEKKLTIKSVRSTRVARYYEKANLGFILRDDVTVNNVACPTKLIEYLGNGVVPVVLTPNIGDFKRLGYSYITLDEFINGEINNEALRRAADNNYGVLQSLGKIADEGREKLKHIFVELKQSTKNHNTTIKRDELLRALVERNCRMAVLEAEVSAYENQVRTQIKMIEDYASSVHFLKGELLEIRNSKSWKMVHALRKTAAVRRYLKKPSTNSK